MKKAYLGYYIYLAALLIFVGSIALTPLLAFTQDMSTAYKVFSYTCHQKISRSICLFSDNSIGDCLPQDGKFVADSSDRSIIKVETDSGKIGYKFPVCARDIGLYGAMLLGAIAYPFIFKLEEPEVFPAIYLILAIVPLGLDGSVQLVSELGLLPFTYESTNLIRLITGIIAGFVASFYAVPLIVEMSSNREKEPLSINEVKIKKEEKEIPEVSENQQKRNPKKNKKSKLS